jgi:hypothetical protein
MLHVTVVYAEKEIPLELDVAEKDCLIARWF